MERFWSVCDCMYEKSLFEDFLFKNRKMYLWIILVIFRDNANFFGEITF
ncbi:hypothetical protein bthur0009_15120 [Bacillus thuringiensis serovar andalousiensis BGSC 4AW1]|nr:hypothetical protein bthur0009_15120 [Bacillus thuringiensis serovar andalousiensis BGSC 4AW1]GIX57045.1 hypothetical protein BPADB04_20750 [Bacillus paranthracis]